jgi:ribose transport system permease protein
LQRFLDHSRCYRFGNRTYATGGNIQAAIAKGTLSTGKIVNYIIVSMLAFLLDVLGVRVIRVSIMGQGLEMNAIAATDIGGTLLSGGRGR